MTREEFLEVVRFVGQDSPTREFVRQLRPPPGLSFDAGTLEHVIFERGQRLAS
jgi:hypothetical protein